MLLIRKYGIMLPYLLKISSLPKKKCLYPYSQPCFAPSAGTGIVNNISQREVWPLPLAPGKWSLGCWNVLPVKSVFVYLGHQAILISLTMWLMIKALGHMVSTLLLEGLETKCQAHRQSTMSTWLSSNKNSEHRSLVSFPGWLYSVHIVRHHCWER